MINKAIVQGRLGKDAEVLKTKDDKPYCRMNVAHADTWKDQDGEWRERTTWVPVITFQEGLIRKVLKDKAVKGAHVLVEGELSGFDYTDRNNIRRVGIEVSVGRSGTIQILPAGTGGGRKAGADKPPAEAGADDTGAAG